MSALLDQETGNEARRDALSIATGLVVNNIDLIMEGKVEVRIPARGITLWARLTAIGAGTGAGFYYVPRIDDEVLVAFAGDQPTDAFVLGGLWSLRDRIPVTDPVRAVATRVVKSGVAPGVGQEIELDDLMQSITLVTVTGQKITMNPNTIELTNLPNTTTITLTNATQSVSIKAAASITLEAPQISLKGATVEINGVATTTVASSGVCNVTAPLVKIN